MACNTATSSSAGGDGVGSLAGVDVVATSDKASPRLSVVAGDSGGGGVGGGSTSTVPGTGGGSGSSGVEGSTPVLAPARTLAPSTSRTVGPRLPHAHPAVRDVVKEHRMSIVMRKDGVLASLASVGSGFKLKPVRW